MNFKILIVLVLVSGACNAQDIVRSNPDGMTASPRYSHLVRFDRMLFIAGQVALDAEGNVVGSDDMQSQVRQVMKNLETVLASVGADFSDVVKVNIFTTDIERFREAGDIYSSYIDGNAPASTLVQIDRLARPVFLVEIEAIAIAPE